MRRTTVVTMSALSAIVVAMGIARGERDAFVAAAKPTAIVLHTAQPAASPSGSAPPRSRRNTTASPLTSAPPIAVPTEIGPQGAPSSGTATQNAGAPASSTPTPTPAAPSPPSTQTFTGESVSTRYGPVQVQITVRAHQIDSAQAIDYPQSDGRSQEINSQAIPQLNQETLDAQSAQVDTVSGATYTSDGYRRSLQSALDAAHAAGVM